MVVLEILGNNKFLALLSEIEARILLINIPTKKEIANLNIFFLLFDIYFFFSSVEVVKKFIK